MPWIRCPVHADKYAHFANRWRSVLIGERVSRNIIYPANYDKLVNMMEFY